VAHVQRQRPQGCACPEQAPSPGLAAFIARGGRACGDAGVPARLSAAMATLADVRERLHALLARFLAAASKLEAVRARRTA